MLHYSTQTFIMQWKIIFHCCSTYSMAKTLFLHQYKTIKRRLYTYILQDYSIDVKDYTILFHTIFVYCIHLAVMF